METRQVLRARAGGGGRRHVPVLVVTSSVGRVRDVPREPGGDRRSAAGAARSTPPGLLLLSLVRIKAPGTNPEI